MLALFGRDVFRVHFGLVPVQHEGRIGIEAHDGAAEAHAIVFLQARSFGLAWNFYIEVGLRSLFNFLGGGPRDEVQLHRIGSGDDVYYFADDFREFGAADSQPGHFGFVAAAFEIREHGQNVTRSLNFLQIVGAGNGVGCRAVGRISRQLKQLG